VAAGIFRVRVAEEIPSLLREFGIDPNRTIAQAGVDIRMPSGCLKPSDRPGSAG
jgi:hypothetical protein